MYFVEFAGAVLGLIQTRRWRASGLFLVGSLRLTKAPASLDRAPKGHINIRIQRNMISGIPITWGLESRM